MQDENYWPRTYENTKLPTNIQWIWRGIFFVNPFLEKKKVGANTREVTERLL